MGRLLRDTLCCDCFVFCFPFRFKVKRDSEVYILYKTSDIMYLSVYNNNAGVEYV